MLDNFIVALTSVLPLFALIAIGGYVKKANYLTPTELGRVNNMVFRIFFFFMMFYNIYMANLGDIFNPALVAMGVGGVLATIVIAWLFVVRWEPANPRRGVLIQAIFRSNFVIMGIPIIGNVYGVEALAVPTMMIVFIVPIYNILGVLSLEMFRQEQVSLDIAGLLRGIINNPMILGGMLAAMIRVVGIELPDIVLKPVGQVATATTPIALIILGASFRLGSFHDHFTQLVVAVIARLIIAPAILLGLAVFLGFRGVELMTLMAIFAAPCAVAGYAMAQSLGGDAELAGNCVVYTSGLSCFTIFGWVFLLKSMGLV